MKNKDIERMVEVKYPDGHKTLFYWINKAKGYGYILRNNKVYRYPLPK